MSAKHYYRVDKRDVADGDELPAEGNYQSEFDNIGKQAEAILEGVRVSEFPSKPARADSVFVTNDLPCAEWYWRTHDKRYLYEVDVDEDAIKHRGDMNWVDAIGDELKRAMTTKPDDARCRELARKYWNEEMSDRPCPEFLLDSVKVQTRVKDLSDLKGYVRSHVPRYDPTQDETDEEMIRRWSNSDKS